MRLTACIALGAGAGVLALAACAQTGGAALAAAEPCAASSWQTLVGQPTGELDTTSLPQPVRMLSPGEDLSGDPTPERMTIVPGADGRVAQVVCH